MLISCAFTLLGFVFLPVGKVILSQAYSGKAFALFQWIFNLLATDAYKTPLELYISKLEIVYAWTKVPLALGWLGAALILMRQTLPHSWHRLTRLEPQGWLGLVAAGALLGLAILFEQLRRWRASWLAPIYWSI